MRLFTNKPACGPKRGHGTPQPRFALECHLDKVAEDLGIDPVELRRRNLVVPFSTTVNWLRVTSCGLPECLDRVIAASGFARKHRRLPRGRGVGFALSAYLSGAGLPVYWNELPHSGVQLTADRGGGVSLSCGATDIGQGSDYILTAAVAEILGIGLDDISLVTADTARTPVDLGSYSSRVTFMAGNAAIAAARQMRTLIARAVASRLEVSPDDLVFAGRRVSVRGVPTRGVSWDEACTLAEAAFGPLVTSGSYTPPKLAGPYKGSGVGPSPAYSFSACVAEVSVDEETGMVTVDRVWLAHDIGRALNPLLVTGQIEGSVYMAVGEALFERQGYRAGAHAGPSLLDYKLPTLYEIPEVETILIESIDPEGPFGAKECGQGPLLPVVPAIANAIYDAVGVRCDEVPITPDKLLRALTRRAKGGSVRIGPAASPPVMFGPAVKVPVPEA
jgi:4-hydroxybenzoyl-CoA reductase subunit alpha